MLKNAINRAMVMWYVEEGSAWRKTVIKILILFRYSNLLIVAKNSKIYLTIFYVAIWFFCRFALILCRQAFHCKVLLIFMYLLLLSSVKRLILLLKTAEYETGDLVGVICFLNTYRCPISYMCHQLFLEIHLIDFYSN